MNIYKLNIAYRIVAVILLVMTIIMCIVYYRKEHFVPFGMFVMLIFAIIYFYKCMSLTKDNAFHCYIVNINNKDKVDLQTPKLSIKKSNIPNAGNGVFAEEFIPKGTYFYKFNFNKISLLHKMNDLNYKHNANTYEWDSLLNDATNIEYVFVEKKGLIKQLVDYINGIYGNNLEDIVYLRARRDIYPGQELSKYYGADFWHDHEKKMKK